jgi:hypothetical protein
MHTPINRGLIAAVLCGLASMASAQEYCVTCSGPDTRYRCIIGGEPSPAARSSRGQLLCITELARSGGHASCSVGRTTSEPCDGEMRTVLFPAAADPAAAPVGEAQPGMAYTEGAGAAPEGGQVAQELQAPEEGPPKTVEELAKKTVEASGEGLKKAGQAVGDTAQSAGNAVGNAVKKTWNCLSSFFSDC